MGAVYRKELRSFFTTMTGYIFIAFLLLITGIFATAMNFKSYYPNFEYVLGSVSFTFLFLVPILTMRSFSEEKHSRTDQLLYSLPLSVKDIVLGKYFAMLTVFAIAMGVMCLYPIILGFYGTVYYITTYGAMLAFFLLGAALIAIGMFMSTLTESQLIAAVFSFGAMLLCYLMAGISSLIPSTALASFIAFTILILALALLVYFMTKNTTLSYVVAIILEAVIFILFMVRKTLFTGLFNSLLGSLSVFERFDTFTGGMFDITAVIYYISVSVLFVFFSAQAVEKKRWS